MTNFTLDDLKQEVAEFRAAEHRAAPGPWTASGHLLNHHSPAVWDANFCGPRAMSDCRFAAACRPSDNPTHWADRMEWLIAEVERLRAENFNLSSQLEQCDEHCTELQQTIDDHWRRSP